MSHYKTPSVSRRDFYSLVFASLVRCKFIVKRVHDKTIHYAYQHLKLKNNKIIMIVITITIMIMIMIMIIIIITIIIIIKEGAQLALAVFSGALKNLAMVIM